MASETPESRDPPRWLVWGLRVAVHAWWHLLVAYRRVFSRPAKPKSQPPADASVADGKVTVPMSWLVDIAIDGWRLERWLSQLDSGHSNAAGRFVSRRIADFVGRIELETVDLTGQRYEPGLAVELLGNIHDETLPPDTVLVDEMVAPLCLWQGRVVRLGQVVTRSSRPNSSGEQS